MHECDPTWEQDAIYQYYKVHEMDWQGEAHAYTNYADHVDYLHAKCCANANADARAEWCK